MCLNVIVYYIDKKYPFTSDKFKYFLTTFWCPTPEPLYHWDHIVLHSYLLFLISCLNCIPDYITTFKRQVPKMLLIIHYMAFQCCSSLIKQSFPVIFFYSIYLFWRIFLWKDSNSIGSDIVIFGNCIGNTTCYPCLHMQCFTYIIIQQISNQ